MFKLLSLAAVFSFVGGSAFAQISRNARPLVSGAVNPAQLVTLAGNTRHEANAANDRGRVSDDRTFDMRLQLKRPSDMQDAMEDFIHSLSDPTSPNFHHWLTPAQFSERFGLAASDIDTVKEWLRSAGFTVGGIGPTLTLQFSGTARQIRQAFHTEIHNLSVSGQAHLSNMSDPQIPAALAEVIGGVTSLQDFRPRKMVHLKKKYTVVLGDDVYNLVTPADLAKIYNFTPLFTQGITGRGQTIAVLEDTNVYDVNDWAYFRKAFGLARPYPYGTFRQVHPSGGSGGTCSDPGVNSDEDEATLDAEWASAAAPNANIVLASCDNTDFNYGLFIALENMLTSGDPLPPVISISYGLGESELGRAFNIYIGELYAFAAVQGVSVFVSTGDEGAAGNDGGAEAAIYGINVSGLATTPFNVAVGGTDFSDTFFGVNSNYWSNTNGATYGSALSYIPETPWNTSCASFLVHTYVGYAQGYGQNGFCNSSSGESHFLTTGAASGGPSECAFGMATAEQGEVVSGTCRGWPKPRWQRLVGVPDDGVRGIPDVSLFAANGLWGHLYVFCFSEPAPDTGGAPCAGTDPATWADGGGTSFAAPIMAGVQALINQSAGGRQGNPNPIYYAIARAEYGANGSAACNSNRGKNISPACIFYDVTLGDITVNCRATPAGKKYNCYVPSGTNGSLSVSNTTFEPAFPATTGWDFATGIGTVNVTNLTTAFTRVANAIGR